MSKINKVDVGHRPATKKTNSQIHPSFVLNMQIQQFHHTISPLSVSLLQFCDKTAANNKPSEKESLQQRLLEMKTEQQLLLLTERLAVMGVRRCRIQQMVFNVQQISPKCRLKLTSISKFGTRFIFVLMESMYNFCFTPNRRKDVCCNNFPFSFPPHCEIKLYNNYFSSQLELVHILLKSELKNQQQVCQRKKKNLNVHLIFGEQLWKWIALIFVV